MDFCQVGLQLLGTLERRRGALCPFAFLLTMEKLQLYSPRRLCYNSLVLGVWRCTGQEISACREASLGRSKLGRSKLGRNGENIGRSAPYRSEKNAEYLEAPQINRRRMNKVTGRFFAPCRRNEETKQTSGLPRLFLCFCMEPRSLEQPPALPVGGHEAAGRSSS